MLNHWSRMAKRHWQIHLPGYFEILSKNGTLEQELEMAGNRAAEMMADLMSSGMKRNEAMEIVLPQTILLRPERETAEIA